MKSIFITIPWFLPAYKAGGPVQSISNMVNEFREGVKYKIFCSNTDLNHEPLVNIETGKWLPYNSYTDVWYATTHERSETLLAQVKLCKPDVLYVVGIYDWHFNIVPLIFCKVPNKILSVRGMLHPGALSEKKLKKKLFLQVFKAMGLQRKVLFHVTDKPEESYTKTVFGPSIKTVIAANFPRKFHRVNMTPKEKGCLRMVSIALISAMKSHLLVLQALANCTSQVVYDIYGPVKDTNYWQLCSQQIEKLPVNVKVQYNGVVQPGEVGQTLSQYQVFILPSKSENFGHAIYEALSAGLPVITSKHTPWNNLAESNAGINVDSEVPAITKAISHFAAMDATEFEVFIHGAIQYADDAIDIREIRRQYISMFDCQ